MDTWINTQWRKTESSSAEKFNQISSILNNGNKSTWYFKRPRKNGLSVYTSNYFPQLILFGLILTFESMSDFLFCLRKTGQKHAKSRSDVYAGIGIALLPILISIKQTSNVHLPRICLIDYLFSSLSPETDWSSAFLCYRQILLFLHAFVFLFKFFLFKVSAYKSRPFEISLSHWQHVHLKRI